MADGNAKPKRRTAKPERYRVNVALVYQNRGLNVGNVISSKDYPASVLVDWLAKGQVQKFET